MEIYLTPHSSLTASHAHCVAPSPLHTHIWYRLAQPQLSTNPSNYNGKIVNMIFSWRRWLAMGNENSGDWWQKRWVQMRSPLRVICEWRRQCEMNITPHNSIDAECWLYYYYYDHFHCWYRRAWARTELYRGKCGSGGDGMEEKISPPFDYYYPPMAYNHFTIFIFVFHSCFFFFFFFHIAPCPQSLSLYHSTAAPATILWHENELWQNGDFNEEHQHRRLAVVSSIFAVFPENTHEHFANAVAHSSD